MKYIFEVKARPKNEKVDKFMADWNKSFSELHPDGGKILYNKAITDVVFTMERELTSEEKKRACEKIKEVFDQQYSDVVVKIKQEIVSS